MKIISIKQDPSYAIEQFMDALEQGKVIIYPTETVYGIGGDALNKKTIDKIYKIKKRDKKNPLSVIVKDLKMIEEFCKISGKEKKEIKKYLPGPYTVLLERKKSIPASKKKKLGIRIPKNSFLSKIRRKLKVPLITTSANLSSGRNPRTVKEIPKEILKKVDLIFDGGETKLGFPSTVVDLKTGKILRK